MNDYIIYPVQLIPLSPNEKKFKTIVTPLRERK